ncbi:alcaligin biosynthesis protein [Photobacterium phosphoreum]|uniref:lysine N(6)-hydroxylase/L-ornithine N(5)-oxygenase family protein n=1 Tax=Photobacterium phosphoreum TaxID=659 RepID=UPI001E602D4F|nr:SidA/IucD/PvdA family monooxygenase [Photobacterium phosphoreum]MCD9463675.1 alcaligin biosynthesis protein [Photobacterium phosphoreum]
MNNPVYDFIAIGLGPFNLGLAALTHTLDDVNGLFLDKNEGFDWHPGMMLENAHLQTTFMSDLVTLADPTHLLSFLNYIKQQGRLYSFYIREDFFLMRKEYNQYCQWATKQISTIRFQHNVTLVNYDREKDIYQVEAQNLANNSLVTFHCRHLVLGTGPTTHIPDTCKEYAGNLTHTSNYLFNKNQLQQNKSITIVGGGQSAAEIYYDLLQDIDSKGYQLNWITRSPRFFPLEYSKLTLEMTSPEYVDYFYHLPPAKRDQLIAKQKHLYKGINTCLINDIFDLLYVKRLDGEVNTRLITNTTLEQVSRSNDNFTLGLYQDEQESAFKLDTQGLILATGYTYQLPDFLEGINSEIKWDNQGRFDVNRNYSIDKRGKRIFVQNAELHTHGFVTPDLGMACYRNSILIKEITGIERYPIEKRIAFQEFATPVQEGVLTTI